MKTVLIVGVAGQDEAGRRFMQATRGEVQGRYLIFPTIELMHKVMTARPWAMIQCLQQQGPLGLGQLSRAMELDSGNLTRDLKPLKEYGLIVDTERRSFSIL
jgi:predicted transcriptional regulator